jgi:hypothetical protein
MQPDHRQQADARGPEDFHIGLEEMPVTVKRFRAEEKLQVANHVPDDEEEQPSARDCHDELPAECGCEYSHHSDVR